MFRGACLLAFVLTLGGAAACRDSDAGNPASGPAASSEGTAAVADLVLPGVDTSPMTPRERHEWSGARLGFVCPVSRRACLRRASVFQEKRACSACTQAAKWIAHAVREGATDEQIQRAYKARFDPSGVKTLPIDGSPTKGPPDATVTLFEFADFECPHCREAVPMVDAVLAAHPGRVRLVYKSYTLPFHVHGESAARAAFAAGMQGKFWEMEHLLFERQQNLEAGDLERYAQMLKLEIPKWKADMVSPEVSARITHDHDLGESLKLKGTPTIYVNGRELDVEEDETLEGRVAAELGQAPGQAAAQPEKSAAPAGVDAAPNRP